jgi:N6-L-threonylcarbamoyladenine synthase
MPRAMLDMDSKEGNWEFSFSGIKTHVLYLVRDLRKISEEKFKSSVPSIAASFQEAVCDVLVAKTIAAALHYNIESVIITGGVSANERLREKMEEASQESGIRCYFPAKSLTGDNAAMIGIAAYLKYAHTKKFDDIFTLTPNPDLKWENTK